MTNHIDGRRWLAARLLRHGVGRLGKQNGEWAQAMASEADFITSDRDELAWAAGCAVASYRTPQGQGWLAYVGALSLGLLIMTAYQWSADESLQTLAIVSLLALALGLFRPDRFIVSGALIGLVVAGVNMFETLTGVQPGYETFHHTVFNCLQWTLLAAPAIATAALGGYAGRKLRRLADTR